MIDPLYLKALHLVFVVTWFSGLFYIVRLFIYHKEALQNNKQELVAQFKIMEKRLWFGITWPSAIITALFGFSMLHQFFPLKDYPWMQLKLIFLLFLYSYHFICHKIYKQAQADAIKWSPMKLRLWNEGATIFLFAIIFLVVLKDLLDFAYAIMGILGLIIALTLGVYGYRYKRKNLS